MRKHEAQRAGVGRSAEASSQTHALDLHRPELLAIRERTDALVRKVSLEDTQPFVKEVVTEGRRYARS